MTTAAIDTGRYQRDGFVRLPRAVDPDVGRRMYDDVVTLCRADDPFVEGTLVMPEANLAATAGDAEDRISKVFKLHRRPAFVDFLRSPLVADIAVDRLGPDVDCFLSQFIFKNPGAWGQPWHQDSFYFPFEPARPIIGLWLAVTEATLENGCLHVLPGSHTEPVKTHVPDKRPGANYGYVEIIDHDMSAATPVLMDPGDLLVFDSHLMHRSTDNESDGIRAAMVFHLCRAGTLDRTEEFQGNPSVVNDFMPLLRDGEPVE